MRINPIPVMLLPHSATYTPVTLDEWQREVLGSPVQLAHIRIEPSSSLILSKENKEQRLRALLFFDAQNSLPAAHGFALGDRVTFGLETFHVASVDVLYALEGDPHHWEVGLV